MLLCNLIVAEIFQNGKINWDHYSEIFRVSLVVYAKQGGVLEVAHSLLGKAEMLVLNFFQIMVKPHVRKKAALQPHISRFRLGGYLMPHLICIFSNRTELTRFITVCVVSGSVHRGILIIRKEVENGQAIQVLAI